MLGTGTWGTLANTQAGSDYKLRYQAYNYNDSEGTVEIDFAGYLDPSSNNDQDAIIAGIPLGTTSIRLFVEGVNDEIWEQTETVTVRLVDDKETIEDGYGVDSSGNTATVNINDNEPTVSLGEVVHPTEGFGFGSTIEGFESALSLDGTNYVNIAVQNSLNRLESGTFTQEAWIFANSDDNNSRLLIGGVNIPSIWIKGDSIVAGFNNNEKFEATSVLNQDSWNHIATTFDGTDYKIYLNGVELISTSEFAGRSLTEISKINIGGSNIDNNFIGAIDEVRMWNIARSQGEIQGSMLNNLDANTAGLVGYWQFEENSEDKSSNINHGIFQGNAEFINNPAPQIGYVEVNLDKPFEGEQGLWVKYDINNIENQSLSLNGVNDYISFAQTINIQSNYSIEGWFYSNDNNKAQDIVALTNSGSNHYVLIELGADGRLRFLHRTPAGNSGGSNIFSNQSYQDGQWHHFAAVKTFNRITLYVDGDQIDTVYNTAIGNINDNVNLTIGRLTQSDSLRYFKGNLDEVRVWDKALTQTQIQQNRNKFLLGNEAGLLAYWDFNGNTQDKTGNNNNGILNGVSGNPYSANQELVLRENDDYFNSRYRRVSTDILSERNGIIIPQGETSARIYISALNDAIVEGDEQVEITLIPHNFDDEENSSPLNSNYNIDSNNNQAVITIKDNQVYTKNIALFNGDGQLVTGDNPLVVDNQGNVNFGVTLTSQPEEIVTVTLTSSDGTLSIATLLFNSSNWDTAQTVSLNGASNIGNITATATGYILNSISFAFTNIPSDKIMVEEGSVEDEIPVTPEVSVIALNQLTEGNNQAGQFEILLSAPAPEGGLNINYSVSGSASNADYMLESNTIRVEEGETKAIFSVFAKEDAIAENNETIQISLNNGQGYTVNSNGNIATLTISDNDIAILDIVNVQTVRVDGEDIETYSSNLSTLITSEPYLVQGNIVEVYDENNQLIVSQTLTQNDIEAGTLNINTSLVEGSNISVVLKESANADNGIDITPQIETATGFANAQIVSDGSIEIPLVQNDNSADFAIRLTSKPTANVSVNLVGADQTEGILDTTTLTFTPDNWNQYQKVNLTGVDDSIVDGNINYSINAQTSSTDSQYQGKSRQINVTNLDDEQAISKNAIPEIPENLPFISLQTPTTPQPIEGETIQLTVNLSQPASVGGTTVNYTIEGQGFDSSQIETVTIAEGQTSAIITVNTVDNLIDEDDIVIRTSDNDTPNDSSDDYDITDSVDGDDEAITVRLINSDSNNYQVDSNNSSTKVEIQDNDTAGIIITPVQSQTSTSETDLTTNTSLEYSVQLNTQPTANVDVYFGVSDGSEGILATSLNTPETYSEVVKLTFSPKNWNIAQNVYVMGVDDEIDDGEQPFKIYTSFDSGDRKYRELEAEPIALINEDDSDEVGITITPPTEIQEGRENVYGVKLNSQPVGEVRVIMTPDTDQISLNNEDIGESHTLIFDKNNWNLVQTVRVTSVDDTAVEYFHTSNINFEIETGQFKNFESRQINNTPEEAFELGEITGGIERTNLTIDNNDIDWYKFVLPKEGTANDFVYIQTQENLSIELFDNSDAISGLLTGVTDGDKQRINLAGLDAGQYWFKVTSNNNTVAEYSFVIGDEDYKYRNLNIEPLEVIIKDNDLPTASIIAGPTASELFSEPSYFTVQLNAPAPLNGNGIEVKYQIAGGLAENGKDYYAPQEGTVRIAPGEIQANIIISPIDDKVVEDLEWEIVGREMISENDVETTLRLDVNSPVNGKVTRLFAGQNIKFDNDVEGIIQEDVELEEYLAPITLRSISAIDSLQTGQIDSVSEDGRYIVIVSSDSNLVSQPSDTNNTNDVFLVNTQTNEITRVSVGLDGEDSNGFSDNTQISANGRYITYVTGANNIVENDTNRFWDIIVYDNITKENTRINLTSSGGQTNADSFTTRISGDGNEIAFLSVARNIGAAGNFTDAFIYDQTTQQLSLISKHSNGIKSNGQTYDLNISTDGNFVVLASHGSNLVSGDTNDKGDIFVHNLKNGETTRVNVSSSGVQANEHAESPSISGDGRYVTFRSYADNLVSGDNNNAEDIFVHDRQTGTTELVSISSEGVQGNGNSSGGSISGDGRYIIFSSDASNLVVNDENNATDTFIHDRQTGETVRILVDNQISVRQARIAADGLSVVLLDNNGELFVGEIEYQARGSITVNLNSTEVDQVEVNSFAKMTSEDLIVELLPDDNQNLTYTLGGEDVNSNGILDLSEDVNGNGILDSNTAEAALIILDDDVAGVRIVEIGEQTVVIEGETSSFQVSLLSEPTAPVNLILTPLAEIDFVNPQNPTTVLVDKDVYSFNTTNINTFDVNLNSLVLTNQGQAIAFDARLLNQPTSDLIIEFYDTNDLDTNNPQSLQSITFTATEFDLIEQIDVDGNWNEYQTVMIDFLDQDSEGNYEIIAKIKDTNNNLIDTILLPINHTTEQVEKQTTTLTFQPENWYELQTVEITGTPDRVAEPNIYHVSGLSYQVESIDNNYHQIFVPNQTIHVVDEILDPEETAQTLAEGLNMLDDSLDNLTLPLIGSLDGKGPNLIGDLNTVLVNSIRQEGNLTALRLQSIIENGLSSLGLDSFAVYVDVVPDDVATPDFSEGEITVLLDLNKTYDLFEIPLDSDLGLSGLGIGFSTNGSLQADFNYNVNLGFGIHNEFGFYLDSANTGFGAEIDLHLDDFSGQGSLGFLKLDFVDDVNNENPEDDNPTQLNVSFEASINDLDVSEDDDGDRLTIAELRNWQEDPNFKENPKEHFFELVNYEFAGEANLGLKTKTSINNNSAFPSFEFDFGVNLPLFNYNDQAEAGGDKEENKFTVKFKDITLNLGTFLTDFVRPIITTVDQIITPIKPVVSALNADTKFLSYIGLEEQYDTDGRPGVSILELARALNQRFGGNNPKKAERIEKAINFANTITEIVDVINTLNELVTENPEIMIDFGSYTLDDLKAASEDEADSASNVKPSKGMSGGTSQNGVTSLTATKEITSDDINNAASNPTSNDPNPPSSETLQKVGSAFDKLRNLEGLSIPLFEPLTAISLMLGEKNVDLINYDVPDFSFDFGLRRDFPVYTWPTIEGILQGSFSVGTDVAVGFDTFGLEQWQEDGFSFLDSYKVFDGFYLNDLDPEGYDKEEFFMNAEVAAGLGIDIGVASASLSGGVQGHVGFDLEDVGERAGTSDGRVRGSEIISRIDTPLELFELTGEVAAFLRGEVSVFLIGTVWEKDLARFPIAQFSIGGGSSGTVAQSYMEEATVFADFDFDGELDDNEPFTTTNEFGEYNLEIPFIYDRNGNGILDNDEGRFVAIGGKDTSTGLTFASPFYATGDSSMITPLTTLKFNLMESGMSAEVAEGYIKDSLKLADEVDINTFDPISAIELGNMNGLKVYASHIKIKSILEFTYSLIKIFSTTVGIEPNNEQLFDFVTTLINDIVKNTNEGNEDVWKDVELLTSEYGPTLAQFFLDAMGENRQSAPITDNNIPFSIDEIPTVVEVWAKAVSLAAGLIGSSVENIIEDLDTAMDALSPVKMILEDELVVLMENLGNGSVSPDDTINSLDQLLPPETHGLIFNQVPEFIEEGEKTTYTVKLKVQPIDDVTINFSVDENLQSIPEITFTPSNWNIEQTVTIDAIDDEMIEGLHNSTISHTITSDDNNYDGISVESITVTIEDNDLPKIVFGTADDDVFDSAFPEEDKYFIGEEQILFTGRGDDFVDVSEIGRKNRIYTGSGDDIVFAGNRNRISLGAGNDIVFAGFRQGANRISLGAGNDQFWVSVNDNFPNNPNRVHDFNPDEDVIGFAITQLSLGSDDFSYEQVGDDVIISAFGQEIAQLLDTTVTDANFVFA